MNRHAPSIRVLSTAALAVSCLVSVVACGSGDGAPSPSHTASVSETLTVPASNATRSALGVTVWGVGEGSEGTTVFRGYDTSMHPVIEVTHTLAGDTRKNQTMITTVTGSHGAAHMSATLTAEPDAATGQTKVTYAVVENTFDADANARDVMKLLGDDVAANPPSETGTSGGGGSLVQSIHAADTPLVRGSCFSLTTSCKTKLARGAFDLAGAGWHCMSLVATSATALLCVGAAIGTEGAAAAPAWACAAFMGRQIPTELFECAKHAAEASDTVNDIREQCFTGCRGAATSSY